MSFVTLVRWTARGFSGLIVLFFGFFLIAHLIGDQGRPSRPLVWNDYVILTTLVLALVGLLLSWKREFVGAAVTLIAIGICAAINWRVLVPGALIPITAILFLISWWISRSSAHRWNGHGGPPLQRCP